MSGLTQMSSKHHHSARNTEVRFFQKKNMCIKYMKTHSLNNNDARESE